ncbi:hypothetical protein D9M68_553620 [compost metagenome]
MHSRLIVCQPARSPVTGCFADRPVFAARPGFRVGFCRGLSPPSRAQPSSLATRPAPEGEGTVRCCKKHRAGGGPPGEGRAEGRRSRRPRRFGNPGAGALVGGAVRTVYPGHARRCTGLPSAAIRHSGNRPRRRRPVEQLGFQHCLIQIRTPAWVLLQARHGAHPDSKRTIRALLYSKSTVELRASLSPVRNLTEDPPCSA